MKVGDLVKYEAVVEDKRSIFTDVDMAGLVVKMSRTGHTTHSAQVLFQNGTMQWFDSQVLEVVSESR